MSVLTKSWRFDPATQLVVDDSGAVVCAATWGLDPAVGQLIAAAPALAALVHDLHSNLGESLAAWQGEEDSVQDEHANLIADLDAADRRADAVLTGSGAAALPAHTLRALAQSLLERAHQIDKLVPYVVTHSHRHGETFYTTWSAADPTQEQMAGLLVEEYEPDLGETLTSQRMAVADMTGVPLRVQADDGDDEGADLAFAPTSM